MSIKPQSKIEQYLKVEFDSNKEDIWLTKRNTLRKLVGILGIMLPLILLLTLYIDSGHVSPLYSISHYYYTRASGLFVIIVSLLAIFLLVYKGEDKIDFYLSGLAGIFALCLLIFPTGNITDVCDDPKNKISVMILSESKLRNSFHYISAAIFLSCLAFMAIFLFTRSDKIPALRGKPKRRRNRIYRSCGAIMIASILGILANFLGLIADDIFQKFHLTFWFESCAVLSFGIAWLTKAEVFLKDR